VSENVPSDRELMRLHVAALFTHDAQGRLLQVNAPGGKPAARFFLGRTAQGAEWRFRRDLDADVVRALEAIVRAERAGDEFLEPPHGATAYRDLLARSAPVERTWAGPAYRFPEALATPSGVIRVTEGNVGILRPHLEAWATRIAECPPILAAVEGGRAVAVCASVRITPAAHEAGVETAPELRGRGYGARAVAAWAAAVRGMGRIPMYSTAWENAASRALARALGLRRYGTDLHIT
jgi:GNAT superfamily N-acetyltransferase